MSSPRPNERKPNLRADNAPERRRKGRSESGARATKAFYRARPSFTAADFLEPDFVPGYN